MTKTYTPRAKDVRRTWYVVDADGATLGRLASQVAHILRGKHKPTYAPHMDMGDHVVVVNAAKVQVTGQKAADKVYYHHSQYPGGLSEVPYERLARLRPERVIERAVKGMLPRNRLGRQMARKLAVYAGPEHPHAAQSPVPLKLDVGRRTDGERDRRGKQS
jgi:large subunit ribosomal protein L13